MHTSLSIGNLSCSISCLLQPEPHHVRLRYFILYVNND
nr:MAG TPA: hypothetical protein [Caudoviricetes sp.]